MTDLELTIQNLRSNAQRYDKPERYYRGEHDLSFATEKFENAFGSLFREFALNLCPAIIDAVRDKLKIDGFSIGNTGGNATIGHTGGNATVRERADLSVPPTVVGGAVLSNSPLSSPRLGVSAVDDLDVPPTSTVHTAIDSIWQQNRLDLATEEIHLEALKTGDAYAIVWPDAAGGVTIYPQRARFCTVIYDDEMPGVMRFAAKYWRDRDCYVRLNLFYPDRIEKYISRSKSELSLPDFREFLPVGNRTGLVGDLSGDGGAGESYAVPNPFGTVPLFHFSNTCEIGTFGRSEIDQAIPIQNGLNKAVLDMLVAMEFSAFRQRWVTGLEVEYDPTTGEAIPPFKVGCDRLWLATNPQASFGDFNTTDLDQFLKVKDSFRVDMASVTGTPLHYFLQNVRGFASGEALGRAEARFLSKVRDRQKAFGIVWSALMSFALRVGGLGSEILLRPQWQDPAPMAEREFLENLVLKKKLGITTEQALIEAGYGPADVSKMLNSSESAPPAAASGLSVPLAVAGGALITTTREKQKPVPKQRRNVNRQKHDR
jgi:hypothetical protein